METGAFKMFIYNLPFSIHEIEDIVYFFMNLNHISNTIDKY